MVKNISFSQSQLKRNQVFQVKNNSKFWALFLPCFSFSVGSSHLQPSPLRAPGTHHVYWFNHTERTGGLKPDAGHRSLQPCSGAMSRRSEEKIR